MNKISLITFAAFAITVSGCHNGNNSQSNIGGFTINGNVSNMDTGWVYLQHEDSTGYVKDSAKILNHAFTFIGKVPSPSIYYLSTSNKNGYEKLAFFVEDTTIQINIQDTTNKAIVSGSHSNDIFIAYKKAIASFDAKEYSIDSSYEAAENRKDKVAMDSLDKLDDQLEKVKDSAIISYAESNNTSTVSAWAITRNMLYNPELAPLKKAYSSFTPAVQQSSYGQLIQKTITLAERLAIGQPEIDFTMNDTAGKPVSLSSLHGKYVVLDFWASWCHPCRNENPYVVAAFNKYKDKNFTVFSVSLDSKKGAWLKAIKDDGLAWTHVSDLKGWKNAAASMYGIRGIPSNFLLDPDGKIIGHNLMGDDLDKELNKVLK